jgi:hypothetical protein
MDKPAAIQNAVNAVAAATQAVNDYGRDSTEAQGALQAARTAVTTARQHGATDNDLRTARPT